LEYYIALLSSVLTITFVFLVFEPQLSISHDKLFPNSSTIFAQNDSKSITDNSYPIVNDKNLDIQLVATGIEFPASMSFLDYGDILVTEKNTGLVKRILNGTILKDPIASVDVESYWEGGLLGIAVDKTSANHRPIFVYLYYSKALSQKNEDQHKFSPNNVQGNLLYRYEYQNGKLSNPKLLLKLPYPQNFTHVHNGGVVLIGPDHNIYLGVGDFGQPVTKTQNVNSKLPINGSSSIYRLTKDGLPAKGNPFVGDMAKYYAYGMRNTYGMDFDPVTGNLWDTENGPDYGDEINLVQSGFNSGWKKVQGLSLLYSLHAKRQFDPDRLIDFDRKGKYSEPEFAWNETVGVTAIKFLNSDKLGKDYENDIFVGDFDNGNIYHFDLNSKRTDLLLGNKLADKIANNGNELRDITFGRGFGPILDIKVGPDGYLYILSLYEAKGKWCVKIKYADCYKFDSPGIHGSIFRIVEANK
jgi:aldose sugar dehydrogenase